MPPNEDPGDCTIYYMGYGIYLGSWWDAKMQAALERRGIKHVLTPGRENDPKPKDGSPFTHRVYQLPDKRKADWAAIFEDEDIMQVPRGLFQRQEEPALCPLQRRHGPRSLRRPRHSYQVQEL